METTITNWNYQGQLIIPQISEDMLKQIQVQGNTQRIYSYKPSTIYKLILLILAIISLVANVIFLFWMALNIGGQLIGDEINSTKVVLMIVFTLIFPMTQTYDNIMVLITYVSENSWEKLRIYVGLSTLIHGTIFCIFSIYLYIALQNVPWISVIFLIIDFGSYIAMGLMYIYTWVEIKEGQKIYMCYFFGIGSLIVNLAFIILLAVLAIQKEVYLALISTIIPIWFMVNIILIFITVEDEDKWDKYQLYFYISGGIVAFMYLSSVVALYFTVLILEMFWGEFLFINTFMLPYMVTHLIYILVYRSSRISNVVIGQDAKKGETNKKVVYKLVPIECVEMNE